MVSIQDAQHDPALFEKFIEENLKLVHSVVRKFNNPGEHEDYFQVGSIGLVNAAKRFKPEYGNQFATYAYPMIDGEIRRYRRDNSMLSRYDLDICYKIYTLQNSGMSDDEICKALKIKIERLKTQVSLVIPPISLSELVGDPDNPVKFEDMLPGKINVETDVIDRIILEEKLEILRRSISPKEYAIFLMSNAEIGQVKIGEAVGLSQAHVCRIIKKVHGNYMSISSNYENDAIKSGR
jgi:RNA polymerase sigma factor (sigma-70 family)